MAAPKGFAEAIRMGEWNGTLDDMEAAVLRMRRGVTEPGDAELGCKGAQRAPLCVRLPVAATLAQFEIGTFDRMAERDEAVRRMRHGPGALPDPIIDAVDAEERHGTAH